MKLVMLKGLTALLLVAALGLFWLTMPAYLYPGDSKVSRAEAEWLLRSGRWGIPAAGIDADLRPYTEIPGQYMVYSAGRDCYYSKFGVVYTLLSVPPLWGARLLQQAVGLQDAERVTVMFFALYQGVFMAIGLLYLFAIVCTTGVRAKPSALYSFLVIFGTFSWYYLRSTTHEALQWPWAIAYVWHLLAAVRHADVDRFRQQMLHLAAAAFFLLILILCRPLYFLWLPALWFAGCRALRPSRKIRTGILLLCGMTVLLLAIPLLINKARFGSLFATGYGFWRDAAGNPVDRFSFSFLRSSVPGFWLSMGPYSVWSHFPLLIPAVAGWPVFFKKHRYESVLVLLLSVPMIITVSSFAQWHGVFGAGPRYLLTVLPLVSLPAALFFERITGFVDKGLARVGALAVLVFGMILVVLQFNAIALHSQTLHNCRLFFLTMRVEGADEYYSNLLHPGLHTRDLLNYKRTGTGYPPMDLMRRQQLAGGGQIVDLGEAVLLGMTKPDLMLLNPPPWESAVDIVQREMRGISYHGVHGGWGRGKIGPRIYTNRHE